MELGFMAVMSKQMPSLRSGSQKRHPDPKKTRQVGSNVKVMLTVLFDCEGVIHYEFLRHGQMVNKECYLKVMKGERKQGEKS